MTKYSIAVVVGSLGDRSERQQQVVREAERQRDAEQRRR